MFCCIISIPLAWDVFTQLPSLILITITLLIAGDCSLTTVQLRRGKKHFAEGQLHSSASNPNPGLIELLFLSAWICSPPSTVALF